MPKLSHRLNKKTGATYVYSVEKSYWDKEKKSPRNKQVCLGKLDPKTGKIIPSKRRDKGASATSAPGVTATSRVVGPYLLFEQITRKHKLDKMLQKCFSDKWKLMLSLVYFITHKGIALSRSGPWSTSCLHPFGDLISSQCHLILNIMNIPTLVTIEMRNHSNKLTWPCYLGRKVNYLPIIEECLVISVM